MDHLRARHIRHIHTFVELDTHLFAIWSPALGAHTLFFQICQRVSAPRAQEPVVLHRSIPRSPTDGQWDQPARHQSKHRQQIEITHNDRSNRRTSHPGQIHQKSAEDNNQNQSTRQPIPDRPQCLADAASRIPSFVDEQLELFLRCIIHGCTRSRSRSALAHSHFSRCCNTFVPGERPAYAYRYSI